MVLPEGLKFLAFGWWVIHVVAVAVIYAWGYRRGRRDERRDMLESKAVPSPPPGDPD